MYLRGLLNSTEFPFHSWPESKTARSSDATSHPVSCRHVDELMKQIHLHEKCSSQCSQVRYINRNPDEP